MRKIGPFIPAVAAAATAIFLGFAATDTQAQFSISKKEIARAARLQWLDMKRHVPRDPDPRVQTYVECVANSIIATLDRKDTADLDWEVIVFDDPNVNAAVDPHGKIAVLNGILTVANTPDSLAAVLSHEIAHATEEHVLSRARRGLGTDFIGVLVGAAVPQVSSGDVDAGTAIALDLPYDRKQESEADQIGLTYMAKAGYDPRAAIELWKRMQEASDGRPREASFMSSHPSDEERLYAIIDDIAPALLEYNSARAAGHRPDCGMG